MQLIPVDNPHVLGFSRKHEGNTIVVLANFSESPQTIKGNTLRTAGMGRFFEDLITSAAIATSEDLTLKPYQLMWLHRV